MASAAVVCGAEVSAGDTEFFEKCVRPVLASHCFDCHGTDTGEADLRVSSRDDILQGGKSGPAVVPGKSAESLLLRVLRHEGKIKMPKKADRLSDDDIAALAKWVDMGLPWPEAAARQMESVTVKERAFTAEEKSYWAFQPVKNAPPPKVKNGAWCRNEVDRFILAALEKSGLKPAAPASKGALLRRATFDLTGLPPTPEELTAFLADDAKDAFAKVVERLLASPHYGEKWGRHWLDGARYADKPSNDGTGAGFTYTYRDWVVRAFNDDLPYDRFVTMQLAGDLLQAVPPGATNADAIMATAFLGFGAWSDQDSDKFKRNAAVVDDQIDAVGKNFLGLTLACARCHDHKFDPVLMSDYYALAGIFYSTTVRQKGGRLGTVVPGFEAAGKGPAGVFSARDGGAWDTEWAGKIRDAALHVRGDPRRLGPTVPRRFPLILAGEKQTTLFPGIARHADDLCVIRSMKADNIDHFSASLQMATGEQIGSRPSLGSWLMYGLGSENQNLPGFVVLSPRPQPYAYAEMASASFLPASYEGTLIADLAKPLANVKHPRLAPADQRRRLDVLQQLNALHRAGREDDTRLDARIAAFETAFRMQAEAPEAFDLAGETELTRRLYGLDEKLTQSYGTQCLMARRLIERGVRFVHVNHHSKAQGQDEWDQHGDLEKHHRANAAEVDTPIAGLLADLKARDLLKDTLVIWGGEFGRSPTGQGKNGREHHPHGFSMWLAGGGVKGGHIHGSTDEFGWYATENIVHIHDFHATLLHLMGLDHERLTWRHGGRDYRLTDVSGDVVKAILA